MEKVPSVLLMALLTSSFRSLSASWMPRNEVLLPTTEALPLYPEPLLFSPFFFFFCPSSFFSLSSFSSFTCVPSPSFSPSSSSSSSLFYPFLLSLLHSPLFPSYPYLYLCVTCNFAIHKNFKIGVSCLTKG